MDVANKGLSTEITRLCLIIGFYRVCVLECVSFIWSWCVVGMCWYLGLYYLLYLSLLHLWGRSATRCSEWAVESIELLLCVEDISFEGWVFLCESSKIFLCKLKVFYRYKSFYVECAIWWKRVHRERDRYSLRLGDVHLIDVEISESIVCLIIENFNLKNLI